jgi:CRISPR-associated protein Cas2
MRGIICYDFSDDKARTRLVKILSKYGTRVQYSVFEFKLDKKTWAKLIHTLHDKKFLNGNHNIIIIPITDSVYRKIAYLGNVFMAFDYDTMIYSAFGIEGIGEKENKLRTRKKEVINVKDNKPNTPTEQIIIDKIFGVENN